MAQRARDGPNNFEKITINGGINGGGVDGKWGGDIGGEEEVWRGRRGI